MNWDVVAQEYDCRVGETGDRCHMNFLNPVVWELLGDIEGKKILDLACGQGYFSRQLARSGALVTGVDISGELIKIAQSKDADQVEKIDYLVADSADLGEIDSESQDWVVSNMAFHDTENVDQTIVECFRVLKKGGKLLFSIPHPSMILATRRKMNRGSFGN